MKEASLEALAHQDYPFDRLVQELGVPRDASRHPVFDVMVAMETPSEDALRLPGILVSPQLGGHENEQVRSPVCVHGDGAGD